MPIYFYQPKNQSCRLCGKGFDWVQSADDVPLTSCPKCGLSVERKRVSEVHSPKILKKVGPVAARDAGFKVLKRVSSGEYERLD